MKRKRLKHVNSKEGKSENDIYEKVTSGNNNSEKANSEKEQSEQLKFEKENLINDNSDKE